MLNDLKKYIFILFIGFHTHLNAADDPHVFIEQVASSLFAVMQQDQAKIKANPKHMLVIVEQQLMPHVDYVYAALSVLGTQAREVPRDKLDEYFVEFRHFLSNTYATTLSHYSNQIVKFEPTRTTSESKIVSVNGVIKETGKPDINITFQVRKNAQNEWKAFNLIAEGISLVQSKRADFAPMLRQQGIDSVIKFMRDKNSGTAHDR